MAGHVADAAEAVDFVEFADERAEIAVAIAPRVHILAKQRDFLGACIDQRLGLIDQFGPAARDFGAARVRHHAIGAEFVAAFLHRQEST